MAILNDYRACRAFRWPCRPFGAGMADRRYLARLHPVPTQQTALLMSPHRTNGKPILTLAVASILATAVSCASAQHARPARSDPSLPTSPSTNTTVAIVADLPAPVSAVLAKDDTAAYRLVDLGAPPHRWRLASMTKATWLEKRRW